MKRILYILAVLLLLAGCNEKKKASQMMPTPEISVAQPMVKDITLTRNYPGYLTTEQTVDLVARVNGTLQAAPYAVGSRVQKGQVLFVIEPTIYKNSVLQAEANLATAQAQLEYNRNNYTRMKEALKSDAVSRIRVLQTESAVAEGVAAVSNAEAAVNTARTNLSYCYVHAPFNGTVSDKIMDVGNYIGGSVQAVKLATIYKDDRMNAYFNVSDNQWLSMQMNVAGKKELPKTVTVRLGKEGIQTYPAMLDYLSPNVNLTTGTFTVRANLDNPKGVLKSGLYVSITLPYGQQAQAILIPNAAIGTDQLGKYVYTVDDSNKVCYRHITVGQLVSDTLRQVTSGLTPQERYVTKALIKVRNGMQIKPVLE